METWLMIIHLFQSSVFRTNSQKKSSATIQIKRITSWIGYCVNSYAAVSEGILYIVAFHLWSYFIYNKHVDGINKDI
ncbi:hypothetical protein ACTXT7_000605 [Hymenolepis weldensis]